MYNFLLPRLRFGVALAPKHKAYEFCTILFNVSIYYNTVLQMARPRSPRKAWPIHAQRVRILYRVLGGGLTWPCLRGAYKRLDGLNIRPLLRFIILPFKDVPTMVVYYETPQDLPIRRYQKFNKYLMIAAEVGETIADYDKRMGRAIVYLKNNDTANAAKELQNCRQGVFNALEEYTPSGLALACMVKSVDGKQCDDLTNEGLSSVLDALNEQGYTRGELVSNIQRLKKKSKASLRYIFRLILATIRRPLMPAEYVKSKLGTAQFWRRKGRKN